MSSTTPRVSAWRQLLLRYVAIGGVCFAIDFSILRSLLFGRTMPWALAATIAFVLANGVHFVLNKWLNFRNHDRELHEQFGTYVGVLAVCLAITIATIGVLGHFGVAALTAKVVAIIINVPVGFLGHRYLTFRAGLAPWLRGRAG